MVNKQRRLTQAGKNTNLRTRCTLFGRWSGWRCYEMSMNPTMGVTCGCMLSKASTAMDVRGETVVWRRMNLVGSSVDLALWFAVGAAYTCGRYSVSGCSEGMMRSDLDRYQNRFWTAPDLRGSREHSGRCPKWRKNFFLFIVFLLCFVSTIRFVAVNLHHKFSFYKLNFMVSMNKCAMNFSLVYCCCNYNHRLSLMMIWCSCMWNFEW